MKSTSVRFAAFFLGICLLSLMGCKKEAPKAQAVNDYLPLKPGARYRYSYYGFTRYIYERSTKKGICTWTFLPQSAGDSTVYLVEQSFTGDCIYINEEVVGKPVKDSVHYENLVSTLGFKVLSDGKVALTFSAAHWENPLKFSRLILSDKTDTCQYCSSGNGVCLRKNIGILSYRSYFCGNNCEGSQYDLIGGPY
jgi:hypothetical protein